jgi:alkanesulfonate monooxygenase SsuD/methylene tetrahydromethanopterin reductase-like flavin-dependent oxidoreductase (luciferase family)
MGKLRTPALAARFADEFNVPFVSLSDAAAQFEVVREACRAQGRQEGEIRFSAALTVCCGRDQAEVRRRASALGQDLERLADIGAAGTPAQVSERIAAYGGLGCDRIYLQYLNPAELDHLELLASEVLPAFA